MGQRGVFLTCVHAPPSPIPRRAANLHIVASPLGVSQCTKRFRGLFARRFLQRPPFLFPTRKCPLCLHVCKQFSRGFVDVLTEDSVWATNEPFAVGIKNVQHFYAHGVCVHFCPQTSYDVAKKKWCDVTKVLNLQFLSAVPLFSLYIFFCRSNVCRRYNNRLPVKVREDAVGM